MDSDQTRFPADAEAVIVDRLLKEVVFNDGLDTDYQTPYASVYEDFVMRSCTYRMAGLLIVLLSREQRDTRLVSIRQAVEREVYGTKHSAAGAALDASVRAAMADLLDLKKILGSGSRTEWRWAASWFEAAGIVETNPERLRQCIVHWGMMAKYTAYVVDKISKRG